MFYINKKENGKTITLARHTGIVAALKKKKALDKGFDNHYISSRPTDNWKELLVINRMKNVSIKKNTTLRILQKIN